VTADLLLHVVDAAAPDADAQHATVVSILRQLGMTSTQLAKKVGTSLSNESMANSPLQRLQCVNNVLPACQDSTWYQITGPPCAQVVEVHNKMDLVEAASAEDCVEGSGTEDAAEDAAEVPDSSTAADSKTVPTSSRPAPHLQQHSSASGPPHQPPQLAAAATGQQQALQLPRVHVSAVTGAGLGLLLQEIDRKVCFVSSRVVQMPTSHSAVAADYCCAPVICHLIANCTICTCR
jgi:hypothetical protein